MRRGNARTGGRQAGFTIVELVWVCATLSILAAAAFPLIRDTRRQQKEIQLRYALAKLRHAIDEYKRFCDAGVLGEPELGTECYPPDLETLLEQLPIVGQLPDAEIRFLRRIPVDPMTGEAEWGLRSYQDEPDDTWWGGEDVYDVRSLSAGIGLNGIPYEEW
jgi:general secretion pathway protein G